MMVERYWESSRADETAMVNAVTSRSVVAKRLPNVEASFDTSDVHLLESGLGRSARKAECKQRLLRALGDDTG